MVLPKSVVSEAMGLSPLSCTVDPVAAGAGAAAVTGGVGDMVLLFYEGHSSHTGFQGHPPTLHQDLTSQEDGAGTLPPS